MVKQAKETFWNNERTRRGWSLKYISKKIGVPQSTLGAWFAGIKAPRNEHHIEQLCKLFDIPFDKGYNEFYHEERNWDSSKKTQHFYNTYWNNLREKNNLSLNEISEMTGISCVTISSNFSGRYMPSKNSLEKYCKLFEIPIDEGKAQFKKAHEEFIAMHSTAQPEPPSEPETPKESKVIKDVDYTFWPSTFANSQFTIKDVAAYLNVDEAKVEKYFTGEVVPNFNQLRMLCGLYGGIDLTNGKDAFNLLHEHFVNTPTTTSVSEDSDEADNVIVEIMRPFFDEVTYDKFVKIQTYLNKLDKNTLNLVYSVYNNISNIMNN